MCVHLIAYSVFIVLALECRAIVLEMYVHGFVRGYVVHIFCNAHV